MSKDLASPIIKKTAIDKDGVAHYLVEGGLTKHEHFAALFMQGILAGREMPFRNDGTDFETIEEAAVTLADELLKKLADANT